MADTHTMRKVPKDAFLRTRLYCYVTQDCIKKSSDYFPSLELSTIDI
jgi:hypothetical protein